MTDPQGDAEDARATCSRAEAARRLNVTERSVDSYIKRRLLETTLQYITGTNRRQRLIYIDSIDRFEARVPVDPTMAVA